MAAEATASAQPRYSWELDPRQLYRDACLLGSSLQEHWTGVSWSPDGLALAATASNCQVHVWHTPQDTFTRSASEASTVRVCGAVRLRHAGHVGLSCGNCRHPRHVPVTPWLRPASPSRKERKSMRRHGTHSPPLRLLSGVASRQRPGRLPSTCGTQSQASCAAPTRCCRARKTLLAPTACALAWGTGTCTQDTVVR